MPAVGSPQTAIYWEISGTVGVTTVDVLIEVNGAYEWDRPEDATRLEDPCGGPPTIIYVLSGTLPYRNGAPEFIIPDLDPTNTAAVQAALEAVYRLRGPWQVRTPTETFNFVVDPTTQKWSWINHGVWRSIKFGIQEV